MKKFEQLLQRAYIQEDSDGDELDAATAPQPDPVSDQPPVTSTGGRNVKRRTSVAAATGDSGARIEEQTDPDEMTCNTHKDQETKRFVLNRTSGPSVLSFAIYLEIFKLLCVYFFLNIFLFSYFSYFLIYQLAFCSLPMRAELSLMSKRCIRLKASTNCGDACRSCFSTSVNCFP